MDFGGWDMPIEYGGVVAEHTSVREAVGMFDVSHMGKLQITGPAVIAELNAVLASDLGRIEPPQAQYSMLLNSEGGVIDDLIVYVLAADEVWIVPNASNVESVLSVLIASLPTSHVTSHHETHGIVAVQGPQSKSVLTSLGISVPARYMSAAKITVEGHEVVICRTGYTGEHGYELIAPHAVIVHLWSTLIESGVTPCGLGARDTLRLEMGYPLHGHEISPSISPVQAKLSWAIGWDKPAFHGRETVVNHKLNGVSPTRIALKAIERGIPRADMNIVFEGNVVGVTTSGTFSPTLKTGIALGLADNGIALGSIVQLDVRGRFVSCEVVKIPFVESNVNSEY